jgi:hypothetical protein
MNWVYGLERLPDDNDNVLVTLDDWLASVTIGYWEHGHWRNERDERFIASVIAWMPLPEPAKAKVLDAEARERRA